MDSDPAPIDSDPTLMDLDPTPTRSYSVDPAESVLIDSDPAPIDSEARPCWGSRDLGGGKQDHVEVL